MYRCLACCIGGFIIFKMIALLTREKLGPYSGLHMENSTEHHKPKKDNTILFYILGGVVVTAVIIAGFVLYRPAQTPPASQPVLGQETNVQPTAAPAAARPIGTLACSQQFYNTVNGVPENYYLSTEGEAPSDITSVTCTITASVNNQVVATDTVVPSLIAVADRGGSTFRCTTKGLKLKPGVATKVTTDIKDNNNNSVSCNRSFLLP